VRALARRFDPRLFHVLNRPVVSAGSACFSDVVARARTEIRAAEGSDGERYYNAIPVALLSTLAVIPAGWFLPPARGAPARKSLRPAAFAQRFHEGRRTLQSTLACG
jgi:hypothetical protein